MNDDPESVESEMSESQAKSFKELNCLIMNSVSYIKTLAEADLKQVEEKKIILPLIENNKSRIFVHPLICGLYLSQLYRENYNLRFGWNTDSQSNSSWQLIKPWYLRRRKIWGWKTTVQSNTLSS